MTRLYRATNEARFWQYVDKSAGPDGCWLWTGGTTRKGYGNFWTPARKGVRANRFALELELGRPLGENLMALHTCDNPPCVNAAHLYEGTHVQNGMDCVNRGRHHKASMESCKNGHAWSEENTRWRTKLNKRGVPRPYRVCRTCARESQRERMQRFAA